MQFPQVWVTELELRILVSMGLMHMPKLLLSILVSLPVVFQIE